MSAAHTNSILRYELIGMVFIVILGSMLHFTFEWSGSHPLTAIFSSVNESVWEHLKLGFWPALLYAIVEYRYLKKESSSFLSAKTAGIFLIPITIIVLFYGYTAVLGEDLFIMDILTFILAVIVGQLASYKLLSYRQLPSMLNRISLIALVILGLAFVIFTFYPPRISLFMDPISGGYGIIGHVHE